MHDPAVEQEPRPKHRKQLTKRPRKAAYDEEYPTFSARIPRHLYDRAKNLKATTGKTFAAILAEALDKQEAAAGAAYDRGYADAIEKFAVPFPCCECGKQLYLYSPEGSALVADFLRNSGWGHARCIDA